MEPPIISVVMPVYNADKYLKEAMDSILAQTFTDFEFIIINDGSTDESLAVIAEYSDPRIKLLTRENRGLIATLNEGMETATGKYIARMDADDISLPHRFELQVALLESKKDYVVAGSLIMLIDDDGDNLCTMGSFLTHAEIDSAHINNQSAGAVVVHPTAMIRRSSLIKVGGYHLEAIHAEDFDLWLRLAEIGKLCNIDEVLLKYRQHFESIGYSHRRKQLKSIECAIRNAQKRRGLELTPFPLPSEVHIKSSSSEVYLKWGWWSLQGENIQTARKYARKAIISSPLKLKSWKLFVCSLRGF